jgi:hypothetical protein
VAERRFGYRYDIEDFRVSGMKDSDLRECLTIIETLVARSLVSMRNHIMPFVFNEAERGTRRLVRLS